MDGPLSLCHAEKGHSQNSHLSLCVIFIGLSVLVCHASKDYCGNFHFTLCDCVAVCPALKFSDIIIHITLCVRVSFSLVCPCGGVVVFKMI